MKPVLPSDRCWTEYITLPQIQDSTTYSGNRPSTYVRDYERMLQQERNALSLSQRVWDLEHLLDDLLKVINPEFFLNYVPHSKRCGHTCRQRLGHSGPHDVGYDNY